MNFFYNSTRTKVKILKRVFIIILYCSFFFSVQASSESKSFFTKELLSLKWIPNSNNVFGFFNREVKIKTNTFIPNQYSLTGGGKYCQGSFAGVGVGLSGSDLGVKYTLYINGSISSSVQVGTGNPISFGSQTMLGTYTAKATDTVSNTSIFMNSSVSVGSFPTLKKYTVSGGGASCYNSGIITVSLSGSDIGIKYQLQNGGVPIGNPIAGSGSPIIFPTQNGNTGIYNVIAKDSITSCTATMNGSANVTIYPNPNLYSLSGGNLCQGNSGNQTQLSGSDIGVSYQLIRNGVSLGISVNGTGSPINFTNLILAGTYGITAKTVSGCSAAMLNTVLVNPGPNNYSLGPGSPIHYCSGGTGVNLSLLSSATGVDYQIYKGGASFGSSMPGTGNSISWGPLSMGNYYVVAFSSLTGCTSPAIDTITVISDSSPTNNILYSSPGNGHYCAGGNGADLILASSEFGVNYQLMSAGVPLGGFLPGTGNTLDFGNQNAGQYYVTQRYASGLCQTILSDTINIVQDSLPVQFAFKVDTSHYCSGSKGANVSLIGSQIGVDYELQNSLYKTVSTVHGSGTSISFGIIPAGKYTVFANNIYSACTYSFTDTATIIADSLPKAFLISPQKAVYCSGGKGIDLNSSGSEKGIQYQLFSAGKSIGNPILGTGNAIDFGIQMVGTYSFLSLNPKSGCSTKSLDSAIIVKDSIPISFILSPDSSHYCASSGGVSLSLSGSEIGINYQLMSSGIPIGSILPGSGGILDFGFQKGGSYIVNEQNTITTCNNLSSKSIIILDSILKVYSLIPKKAHYCSSKGLDLQISGSQPGINYQLVKNGIPSGKLIAGTGKQLDFGVLAFGNYSVMGAYQTGTCSSLVSDTSQIILDSLPNNYILSGNPVYCSGTLGTTLTLSGSDKGITYQLKNSNGNFSSSILGLNGSPIIFINVPFGNYIVIASDSGGCSTIMNSGFAFQVNSPLKAQLTIQNNVCNAVGAGILKVSANGGTSPYSYLWNTGKTDSIISSLPSGQYLVTVKDAAGCSISLSGIIISTVPPVVNNIQMGTPYNTPISLSLLGLIGSKDTTINTNSIDLDPNIPGIQNTINVTGAGMFMADSTGKITFTPNNQFTGQVSINYTISDINGCISNSASIKITVSADQLAKNQLKFPTLFTPNGDGVNDTFRIQGLDLFPNNTLQIFNRWGNQVFVTKSYMTGTSAWNGNGFGEGTYYYLLNVEMSGISKVFSGYIVLIRSGK